MNGMMTGVLLDGIKVGNKRTTLPQAHFRLEAWILVPRVGPDEPGHRSCSAHIPIERWSRRSRRWENSIGLPVVNGFPTVELGNSKDTMKTDGSDL